MKKNKAVWIIVGGTLFAILIILFAVFSVIFILAKYGTPSSNYSSNKLALSATRQYSNYVPINGQPLAKNIDKYNKTDIVDSTNNHCVVFPDSIDNGEISYFVYTSFIIQNDLESPRSEIYLEWNTNKATFEEELIRVEGIKSSLNKKALHTNNLFSLPGFVVAYNSESMFEYALFEEETNTIRYIYLFDVGDYEYVVFPDLYQPKTLLCDSDLSGRNDIENGAYSIYLN